MLTITTVVIMSNCRPGNGNNSQNVITTLLIVYSIQSEKRMLCVEVKFVCDLVSMLNQWMQFLIQRWNLQSKIVGQFILNLITVCTTLCCSHFPVMSKKIFSSLTMSTEIF